jgi:transposase-like protein
MNKTPIRRNRRSPREWASIVEQSFESQLSVGRFAAEAGVSIQSLYAWRRKLRMPSAGFTPVVVKPLEAQKEAASAECLFEIELRNGCVVRVRGADVDERALRTILAVTGSRGSC